MKITVLILIVFLAVKFSSAQDNFQVRYDYDASGNVHFIAENYTNIPVYLLLDFSYLENASFQGELPHITRVNPGNNQLFSIFQELGQPAPSFDIEVKWFIAHPAPETRHDFPYLIPAQPGSQVLYSSAIEGKSKRSVGIELQGDDKVFASRKGVVVRVVANNKPSLPTKDKQFNIVQILHPDGTMGEYFNFAFGKVACEVGQSVIPGQFIGNATKLTNGNYFIGFSLFHCDLYSKNNKYMIPNFLLDESKTGQFSLNNSYKVVHPPEIIKKELTRKEKKKLKKK